MAARLNVSDHANVISTSLVFKWVGGVEVKGWYVHVYTHTHIHICM